MKITVEQALKIGEELFKLVELAKANSQDHVESSELAKAKQLDDEARKALQDAIDRA